MKLIGKTVWARRVGGPDEARYSQGRVTQVRDGKIYCSYPGDKTVKVLVPSQDHIGHYRMTIKYNGRALPAVDITDVKFVDNDPVAEYERLFLEFQKACLVNGELDPQRVQEFHAVVEQWLPFLNEWKKLQREAAE